MRPTAEAVRDAAAALVAEDLEGARVLDLFAGTGALGVEALSRGAGRADFVERNPAALHALKANVAAFRLGKRTRVFKKDVFRFLEGCDREAYDVAFADPPYTSSLAARVVERWRDRPFARILVVETARDTPLPPGGWTRTVEGTALTRYEVPRPRG